MMFFSDVKSLCIEQRIFFKENVELKYYTYFKRGGFASLIIYPKNDFELKCIIKYVKKYNFKYKLVGATSNLIFLNDIEYSNIVSTSLMCDLNILEGQSKIKVSSGYMLADLVRVCLINGYEGMEGLEGIPGSVGGALFMNAGAYGYCISDCLVGVNILDENGDFRFLSKNECEFKYRGSIFKNKKYFILSAVFEFHKGIKTEISKKIERYHIARHLYQEWAYPNLGSLISLNGDIYTRIISKSRISRVILYLFKLMIKNPFVKLYTRKNPSNELMNKFALRYLEKNGLVVDKMYSHKSLNILINTGGFSDDDIIKYVNNIADKCNAVELLENEIVK